MIATEIEMRKNFLRQFDEYIFSHIEDEEIINVWLLEGGLPGYYTDHNLDIIAEDEECWIDCVECFARCCRLAGIID